MLRAVIFLLLLIHILSGCISGDSDGENADRDLSTHFENVISYTTVNIYDHDTSLFTEGLIFYKGLLFESTGSPDDIPYTQSRIGISDLQTGKFTEKVRLDKHAYFGEGIAILNDSLYQLTY